jgi:hypothetical protein
MAILAVMMSLLQAADPAPATADSRSAALTPYRIEAWIDLQPHPALIALAGGTVKQQVQQSLQRIVGQAWQIEIKDAPVSFRAGLPDPTTLPNKASLDKLFIAQATWNSAQGRIDWRTQEYDFASRDWSPPLMQLSDAERPIARGLAEAWLASFRPTAEIVGKSKAMGEISVRGSQRISRASGWQIVGPGTVFQIFRQKADLTDSPASVPWSYLIFNQDNQDQSNRLIQKVEIASLFRDPLTRRSRTKIKLWAMAIPEHGPTETLVTFLSRQDERPIAGFEVAIRPWKQPATYSIGNTNYRGERLVRWPEGDSIPTARVGEVLLLSGSTIVATFPLVPGAPDRIIAQASIDPLLTEIAGQMLSIQEEIVDHSARRRILERQLRKAASDEQLEQTRAIAQKINDLPNRTFFKEKLDKLRSEANQRSKTLKQPRLGSGVNRLFLQTDRLVENIPQEQLIIETAPESP